MSRPKRIFIEQKLLSNPFHRSKSIKLQHHMSLFLSSTTGKSPKNQTIKMHISCLYLKKSHHLSGVKNLIPHTCITFFRFHRKKTFSFLKRLYLMPFYGCNKFKLPQQAWREWSPEIRGVVFYGKLFYKCFHTLCHNYTIKQPTWVKWG